MKLASPNVRWVMSFADLCLLLLGFFVLLQARRNDPGALAAGVRAAFGREVAAMRTLDLKARSLFDPGEAVLRPAARVRIAAMARGMTSARVESIGREAGGGRFDGWELAAARTAAVARALQAGGLKPDAVTVVMPPMGGAATGQTLSVSAR